MAVSVVAFAPWVDREPQPAETRTHKARADQFGDLLPEGALRRIGTLRFRNPGGIDGAALSPDGKLIATASSRKVLRLIDTVTGQSYLSSSRSRGIFC
jgi:hypothetical protein